MIEFQKNLIGIVLKRPSLLKGEMFRGEYLTSPYDKVFDAIKDLYDRYNFIDESMLVGISEKSGLDIFELLEASGSVDDTSDKAYSKMKQYAIDEWRKRQIDMYHNQLSNKQIDFYKFVYAMNMLRDDSTIDMHRTGYNDIQRFISMRDTRIKFSKFKQLETYGHINEGDFVVVAGGTGTGKTALALNLALDLLENYPVLYINIELSEAIIYKRLIATYTKTTMASIDNRHNMPQNDIDKMMELGTYLESKEFYLSTGSKTIEAIQELVANFNQEKHFIVIVDHIGRITSDKESYERMTQTSIAIRNLALDYNCTVLGLCQLNRASKNDNKPSNSMLRDSGEIEQSARKVMFIWNKTAGDRLGLWLWFTKNDSGPTKAVQIKYDRDCQVITEVNDAYDFGTE